MSTRTDARDASLVLAAAQVVARPGRLAASLEAHLALASAAAEAGASLVIFPELSLTGYSTSLTLRDALEPDAPAYDPLSELARRHQIVIVAGAPLASPRGVLIGSITFAPDGSRGTYSKRYLHHSESPIYYACSSTDRKSVV